MPRMKDGKSGSGKPQGKSDEPYLDLEMKRILATLNSPLVAAAHLREAKHRFKEYFVYHTRTVIQRHVEKNVTFDYTQRIIDYAEENGCAFHFVECFFDAFNNSTVQRFVPTYRYGFRGMNRFSQYKDAMQKVMIDAEYTAKRHFLSLPTTRVNRIDGAQELRELEDGVRLIRQVMKFYFVSPVPRMISEALYKELVVINPKVMEYYLGPQDGWSERDPKKKAHASYPTFGENVASIMFVKPQERKR